MDYLSHVENRTGMDKEQADLVVMAAVISSHPLTPKPNQMLTSVANREGKRCYQRSH